MMAGQNQLSEPPDNGKTKRRTLGAYEQAIQDHDWPTLKALIRLRSVADETDADSCWIWTGAIRENGYGFSGRANTARFVHRLVAWADDGFPGDLKTFPAVHHSCGVRPCVNPDHLRPVSTWLNVLEARVRNEMLRTIRVLTEALREVAPHHPALLAGTRLMGEGRLEEPRPGRVYETAKFRVAKHANQTARRIKRLEVQTRRFGEVTEVDVLVRDGYSRAEARQKVGMSRSAYDDWKPRLRAWLDDDKSV